MGKAPVRLLLVSGLLACCLACAPKHKADPFVLEMAIPGLLKNPDGTATNGFSAIVEDWVYEPVMRVAEDGSSLPGLARITERFPDGRVRFALREGATFSDGSLVTLDDLAQSLRQADFATEVDQGGLIVSRSATHLPVEDVVPIVSVWKTVGGERIGSGPFKVVELDAHHMVLQRRAPSVHGINEVRITGYADDREAMAHVLRGEANLLPRVQARDVEFFEGVAHLKVVRGPAPQVVAIQLNPGHLTREERLALARFFPVNELVSTVFDQGCRVWPRASPGGPLPPGRPLKIISVDTDPELARLGLALRRSLGDRAELEHVPTDEFVAKLLSGDYDLATANPLIWPFGMAASQLHSGGQFNRANYSNSAVDAALERGDWLKTEDELDKDPPFIFLCKRERVVVVDSRIKNPVLGPWGLLERLPEWEVGE